MNHTSYSFRIRIKLPEYLRIGISSDKWFLTPENSKPEITLRSKKDGLPISESKELIVKGDGYSSEDEAHTAGEAIRDPLILVFSRLRIGADFGNWFPQGVVTNAGLRLLEQQWGCRILNDVHGLMTFETDPPPKFVETNVSAVLTKGKFLEALSLALSLDVKLHPEERLAFDLFSASFFETTADARLLTLMMAVETLIKPSPCSPEARDHVDKLILLTKNSPNLTNEEKQSLNGSLQWLRWESIRKAGCSLADRLIGQKYMDLEPQKFFVYCYDLRSKLVHGRVPRPTHEEVDQAAVNLQAFVGDLLSGPLLQQITL